MPISLTKSERVLALPADICEDNFSDAFTSREDVCLEDIDREGEWTFLPRDKAETDEDFRHLITYTVLRSQGKVFCYRRGASGGEDRLHGKLSIGVGGHVDENDIDIISDFSTDSEMPTWVESIWDAAKREVTEEMTVSTHSGIMTVGWLRTSETPVDRVHLGVVFAMDLRDPATAKEDCLADGRWLDATELDAVKDELEGWSRVLVESGAVWYRMPEEPKPVYPMMHYSPEGDITEVLLAPANYRGVWINHDLTVYRERETDRVVGFVFKGKPAGMEE